MTSNCNKYKRMKNILLTLTGILTFGIKLFAQPCGIAQSLTTIQQSQISNILNPLDTALKYENLFKIDSLSTELKNAYSTQG